MADEVITIDRFNREIDRLDQEIDKIDRKLDAIDQGGTRGLGVLAVQINEHTKDFAKLEKAVDDLFTELKKQRGGAWKGVLAYALALIPVYLFAIAWFMNK